MFRGERIVAAYVLHASRPSSRAKGDEIAWHFAHASRSVYSSTEQVCEFSFYVSVRMMARQIIGKELRLNIPACTGRVTKYLPEHNARFEVDFHASACQEIELKNVEVEKSYLGIPFDVLGSIQDTPFAIYFTHPRREAPPKSAIASSAKCGIISISLLDIPHLFKEGREQGLSYKIILNQFLVRDIKSKQWIYHPRYRRKKQEALAELLDREREYIRDVQHRISIGPSNLSSSIAYESSQGQQPNRLRVMYECIICHTNWEGDYPSASPCPKCHTHLYRTLKYHLE